MTENDRKQCWILPDISGVQNTCVFTRKHIKRHFSRIKSKFKKGINE